MLPRAQQKNHFPQFERSPEAFPALTIYPDGWDMSGLLVPEETNGMEIRQEFESEKNNHGTQSQNG